MAFIDKFPSKYVPRDIQKDVINKIESAVKSDFKYILLCVPTGVGKSHIATTVARALGTSFIVTAQKILQDQYFNDFPFLYPMKGKSNFPCIQLCDESETSTDSAKNNYSLSCDMGRCTWEEIVNDKTQIVSCEYKPTLESFSSSNVGTEQEKILEPGTQTCHYYAQKFQALLASHALFNYASYFQTRLYSHGIDELLERNCLIADEAHEIEDQIIGYIGYDIGPNTLADVNLKLGDYITNTVDGVIELLSILGDAYTREIRILKTNGDNRHDKFVIRRDKIDALKYELKENPNNFVIQEHFDMTNNHLASISVKPIEIGKYTKQFFDLPTQIFMSATINKTIFCKTMGIPQDRCKYIEIEHSPFLLKNRTVRFHDMPRLNYRSTDVDYNKVYAKAGEILDAHKDEKGLILTTTKKHCFDVSNKLGDRIVIAHEGVDGRRAKVLENHKTTKKPDVLVSPSFWYGVDLKDDLSRFQIILKTPYPSMADERTKIKAKRDPLWYQNKAVEKLLQGLGRSIRNADDYAETHVLDGSCITLLTKMKQYVPKAYWDTFGWN